MWYIFLFTICCVEITFYFDSFFIPCYLTVGSVKSMYQKMKKLKNVWYIR